MKIKKGLAEGGLGWVKWSLARIEESMRYLAKNNYVSVIC